MPWTSSDAHRFTELATTPDLQEMWAEIANRVLADCLDQGGDNADCEERAIRTANDAVAGAIQNITISQYLSSLRSAVRGLWAGVLDYYQFYEALDITVRQGITAAWHEGLTQVGIKPSEMSPRERSELRSMIINEVNRIDGLASRVEALSKEQGGKLANAMALLGPWSTRVLNAKNKAKLLAEGDPKLKWVLGPTEHCSSCMALADKVKRQSFWVRSGIHPQDPPNPRLECGGWNCQCQLVPTDEALTPGRLPNL